MKSRSSTSSSDRPAGNDDGARAAGSGRRALWLCLAVLLLLEFGAARREWIWRIDPRRPVGIMLAVEDEIIAPAEDPRVVVLGSSVMRDALLPRAFEQAADLPPGTVLNTSLPNATPFDLVLLYERNRDAMRAARLLIVGIEDWFFYEEPGISERYHRWASLSERMTDYQGSARLPLLVSWVWKTYAVRQAFALDGLAAALTGERADVIGDDGRTRWRPEERAEGTARFDLSAYEARLRERTFTDRQVRYLVELARLAEADGRSLLVVRMPMRAAALALRERIDPEAEQRLQDALGAVRDAGGVVENGGGAVGDAGQGVGDAGGAGLEDRHFLDERHLGTAGAEVFTRWLAAWAMERYDLR